MKKEEALALGVTEENYKQFRELYNRDLNCRVTARTAYNTEDATRAAILAMLKLIKRPETLDSILKYINQQFYKEGGACQ